MARYIDADAFMQTFCEYCMDDTLCSGCEIDEHLRLIPTADVVERKKGEWLEIKTAVLDRYQCSACGVKPLWQAVRLSWNFCPYCGADMRGEKDE